jgi:hypothetical protein
MKTTWLMGAAMVAASVAVPAQVPYAFPYNPGPTYGTKWMANSSVGDTESTLALVSSAPRPVWARICYSIGPSESTVTIHAQTRNEHVRSFEVAWGGCADAFGTSIWIRNPHMQVVGGYYGIAPATPAD